MFENVNPALLAVLVLAVLGLVEWLKKLGLAGNVLTVASMIIGVVFFVGSQLLPLGTAQLILGGVLFGLGASGLYDLGKLIGGGLKT